jgi:PadR family transcriptional regulator, regulatory protein PadR
MQLQQSSYAVLSALRESPRHGWSVLQELRRYDERAPAVATIYAALDRLHKAKLVRESAIEVVDGRARVIFEITDEGNNALRRHAEQMMRQASRALASKPGLAQ